jgi:hypothetical protein
LRRLTAITGLILVLIACGTKYGEDAGAPDGADAATSNDASNDATADASVGDGGTNASDAPTDATDDAATIKRCDPLAPFESTTPVQGVSSADHEFAPSLSADELTIHYLKSVGATTYTNIPLVRAVRSSTSDPFGPGTIVAASLSLWASMPANGLAVYAGSIAVARRTSTSDAFGDPSPLVGMPANVSHPFILPDESALYFVDTSGIVAGAATIYRAARGTLLDGFDTPVQVPGIAVALGADRSPVVRSDELVIYFTSDRSGGGTSHLWVATRASKMVPFGTPVPVASIALPLQPTWLSVDGCTLYSYYEGATRGDVYVSRKTLPP